MVHRLLSLDHPYLSTEYPQGCDKTVLLVVAICMVDFAIRRRLCVGPL